MDVRIEAAPMEAGAEMVEATVVAIKVDTPKVILALSSRVASFSCPSVSGHSISAVAPDAYYEMEELAA